MTQTAWELSDYVHLKFFMCHLTASGSLLDNSRVDRLTPPMLITAFNCSIFDLKVTGSLVTGLDP